MDKFITYADNHYDIVNKGLGGAVEEFRDGTQLKLYGGKGPCLNDVSGSCSIKPNGSHHRPTKCRDVFERLTDPKFFTGIHRERFDDNGNGRGLAGREDLYLFDGNTESHSRVHEVYSSVVKKERKVRPSTLGIQKFGVQIASPKLMWLYRNGDKHHNGTPFYLRPFIKNMNTLLYEMSKELTLIAGPIRRIYDQNLKPINNINDIVDGAKYLCTSGEPPSSRNRLEKFMSEWIVQKF